MMIEQQQKVMRPLVKLIAVIIVLGIGVMVMGYFMGNPVVAVKQDKEVFEPRVEFSDLVMGEYKVELSAQGQVEPVTETMIVSEVAGAVEYISPKLKTGGRFAKGESMLKVSSADYQAQLAQANSIVADAEFQIIQEQARAVQAMRDWKKLGRGGEPGKLVTREPQLKSARAKLAAAQAGAVQAQRDLAKTHIKAPYDCMVGATSVDAGGYLSRGGRVAEVYTADKVQVRLPLSLEDVSFLPKTLVGASVAVRAEVGRVSKDWAGSIVRTEGKIERATHTMMIVVEMSEADGDGIFKVPPTGLFVKGAFEGVAFKNAVKVPREALRSDDVVWLIDKANKLQVRKVRVERSERDYVVVTNGLKGGERVITSPIELPVIGMKVEPVIQQPKQLK